MKLLKKGIGLVLMLIGFAPFASAQYGFEWINSSQEYYKFKIGEEGLYRIDNQTLASIGVPVSSISPDQFQLFRNGQQVPIYVAGASDNSFDPGDYIEFYGTANDGQIDAPLYVDAASHTNPNVSLANDSAIYFLSWNTGGNNERVSSYQNTNFAGKTADPWIWYKSRLDFKTELYDGSPYADHGYYTEYTQGEGWFSPYIARNVVRTFQVPSRHYNNSGPSPEYEFVLFGKANPINPGDVVDGKNHEAQVSINNNVIFSHKFYGYKRIYHHDTLVGSLIGGTNTPFKFASVYLSKSRQAVVYVQLEYPRNLNVDNKSTFGWEYEGSNDYFKFSNYPSALNQPIIYDFAAKQRILGTLTGTDLEFLRSSNGQGKIYIADETTVRSVQSLDAVTFMNFDPAVTSHEYLIITNYFLDSSAQLYKAYRESPEGGAFDVKMVYTQDLYDLYYYGYHHPMAIRNFILHIYENQSVKPEYLLLLGKGLTYDQINNYAKKVFVDLVPTWGIPPSDYPFVNNIGGSGLAPVMAVGRVPALTNTQVVNYLDKLKLHEAGPFETKVFLQLTGGNTALEAERLRELQDVYWNIAKEEKFGAHRVSYYKDEAVSVTTSLIEEIQNSINQGVHTIGYFGHGAAQVLEVDIGRVEDLNNKGRYPLFLFQGCALGHSFGSTSLPENYLLAQDNGGLSWIASSAFGFVDQLDEWGRIFYTNLYYDQYGESVGNIIKETIKEFQEPWNYYNRAQCNQMTYHGDPAVKLFSPEKPDYEIQGIVAIAPDEVTAETDSFYLRFEVFNNGYASASDTPNIFVHVKYANDSTMDFGPYKFGPVFSSKMIDFKIYNNEWSVGLNTFTIMVDSGNYIAELPGPGEINNTRIFEFFMPSNSVFCLSPLKDEIVSSTSVELIAQNYNIEGSEQEYIFEIDTTRHFNSPLLLTSGAVTGSNIIRHTFSLPPIDSVDYFWRIKSNDPDADWVSSTFAFIYGSESGWSQGVFHKFDETKKYYVELDTATNDFLFSKGASTTNNILVSGINEHISTRRMKINRVDHYPGFMYNGVACVALDPVKLRRYIDSSQYCKVVGKNNWGYNFEYYWPGTLSGAYWYDTRDSNQRDSFVTYLNRIPEGYHLLMYASGMTGIEEWEDTVFKSLEMFGAFKIKQINSGDPYGLYGIKGMIAGEGSEVIADYSSPINPWNQLNELSILLYPTSVRGSITSQPIGPVRSWSSFYRTALPLDDEEEKLDFTLIGIDTNGMDTILYDTIDQKQISLLDVDATVVPYIKVKANYYDENFRTPAHINRWTLLYEGVPEGTLDPSLVYYQNKDTLQEGDSLSVGIAYKNISELTMDSVLVLAFVQNAENQRDTIEFKRYKPLGPGESFEMHYKISTRSLIGNNKIVVSVNPDMDQYEEVLSNNITNFKFNVFEDYKNPLLDVVFDGNHIIDYDIVSHQTLISISVLDENEFLFIDDPSMISATLKYDNDGSEIVFLESMPEVTFTPAQKAGEKALLEYQASDLPSGKYTLTVHVTDASGNASSAHDYEIHFEVIRESSISNVYPYPNPFTTSMQFVFTLTGEQLPDYMKIQILTVTGHVVREISMAELGPLNIGNNISEFRWDGTDMYGDPLANGVYLYKVTAMINGEEIVLRPTAGDVYFTEGIGKIYLMR